MEVMEQRITSTAGVHQMRLLRRHSFIIIMIIVVVDVFIDVVGDLKSLHPQTPRFCGSKISRDGRTDRLKDERTDQRTITTPYRDA